MGVGVETSSTTVSPSEETPSLEPVAGGGSRGRSPTFCRGRTSVVSPEGACESLGRSQSSRSDDRCFGCSVALDPKIRACCVKNLLLSIKLS